MSQVKTVLCPIDFSDLAREELAMAVEVCQTFGAELILHHNLSSVSPGITRAWEWEEVHRKERGSAVTAEEEMKKIIRSLPTDLRAHASVSSGPVATVVLEMARQVPADLIVLGSHGWSTADHASVSERIIDQSPCPVLTIHDGVHADRFKLRQAPGDAPTEIVVATDLSDSSAKAVAYAFELAQHAAMKVHLLHVQPVNRGPLEVDKAERQLRASIPAGLDGRTDFHVLRGEPVEEILALSERIKPGFLVMGEHTRGFFRRFLTKDTARAMLHQAPCPVWFVPPQ